MPLQIIREDLTRVQCDAVVNPTNERLHGTGYLEGKLREAAGERLGQAMARIGCCEPGGAVLTRGFDLPARFVIHTVGPIWVDGTCGEAETLARCYRACLALAKRHRFSSVALPIIAAGRSGFPKAQALEIAVSEIRAFLETNEMDIRLVVYNRDCYEISRSRYASVRAFIDQHYVDTHSVHEASFPNAANLPDASEWESYSMFSASMPDDAAMERDEAPAASAPRPQAKPQATYGAARPEKAKSGRASRPKISGLFSGPDRALDESFSEMLLRKIDERGMTDAQCYKKANVDRKLFSKIRKDPQYRPSKPTAIAFAIALELNLEETRELLMKAGFALSHSQRFDVIIEYFLRERNYDVYEINEVLFEFDQPLLGA